MHVYLDFLIAGKRPSDVLTLETRIDWNRRRIVYLQSKKYFYSYIKHVRHKKVILAKMIDYMTQTCTHKHQSDFMTFCEPIQNIIVGYLTNIQFEDLILHT